VKKMLEKDENGMVLGDEGAEGMEGKSEIALMIEKEKERAFIEMVNSGSFKGRDEVDDGLFGAGIRKRSGGDAEDEGMKPGESVVLRRQRYSNFPRGSKPALLSSDFFRSVMFSADGLDGQRRTVEGVLASYAHSAYSSAVIASLLLVMTDNVDLMGELTYKNYSVMCEYMVKLVTKFKEENARLRLQRCSITRPNPPPQATPPNTSAANSGPVAAPEPRNKTPPQQVQQQGTAPVKAVVPALQLDREREEEIGGGMRQQAEHEKFLQKNNAAIMKRASEMLEMYFDERMSVEAFVEQFKVWKQLFNGTSAPGGEKKGEKKSEEGKGGGGDGGAGAEDINPVMLSSEQGEVRRASVASAPSFPWIDFFVYYTIIDHLMLEFNYVQNYTSHKKRQVWSCVL
jgi:hypothetical protein